MSISEKDLYDMFLDIRSRVTSLDQEKNKYAADKLNNSINKDNEKSMIESMMAIISELRKLAKLIGVNNDSSYHNIDKTTIDHLTGLNATVKELTSQLKFIIDSSPDVLRNEIELRKNKS